MDDPRRLFLGGTDMAALVGLNNFARPIDVWRHKVGLAEKQEDNKHTKVGKMQEKFLAELYEEETGGCLTKVAPMVRPECSYFGGSLDRLRIDIPRVVEIKTAHIMDASKWGPAGTDEIPFGYVIQCQWYMFISDHAECDLIALIGGHDYRLYSFKRDDVLISSLCEIGHTFWNEKVLTCTAPPPDDSTNYADWLGFTYPTHNDVLEDAGDKEWFVMRELARIRRDKKRLEAKETYHENVLKEAIANSHGIKSPAGIVKWTRPKEKTDTDWEALAHDLLENYGECMRTYWVEKHSTQKQGTRSFHFNVNKQFKKEIEAE